jgi:hypothetical protein
VASNSHLLLGSAGRVRPGETGRDLQLTIFGRRDRQTVESLAAGKYHQIEEAETSKP